MTAAVGVRLEVRVLGPVEVVRDGGSVHLGGPRQRALLALLALHANETLPVDRLVEWLFGVDAPATAANAVQVAISRLRRQLPSDVLETHAGGYVLRLAREELDLAQFEQLVAEARTLDPAAAAAAYRRALQLFRGEPLADLAALDLAQPEIRRLDGLRLAAQMDRIDAELAAGRAAELVPDLEALVAEQPLQERACGQLMVALYRAGRQSDALAEYRRSRTLLRDELGLEPSRALQELEVAILRQDPALDAAPLAQSLRPVVVTCPFKGLASYTIADGDYFFGRERVVDELVAQLAASSLVGLVGPSGSGKSSLLQAGLLRALAGGALPGSDDWQLELIRPFDDVPGECTVVAVDQLEELFTIPRPDEERRTFLAALVEVALASPRRRVVVALRADFYGRCAAYPEFAAMVSANHVLLGPMRRDEVADAIERPAVQAGLTVEPELVDALVADVDGEPGALPLLSTALLELWRDRHGRRLTLASYREQGGLDGAVARLAEAAYARLDDHGRATARTVLLRLASEDDGALVRRRVPLDELQLESNDAVGHVLDVLTDARLLTVSSLGVEVSHEALLTEWPRLRGWLDDDRDGRRLTAHLAASAREWQNRGRDEADLYRGVRLVSSVDWAAAHPGELTELEREFVDASQATAVRESAAQRRRGRLLLSLLIGTAALLAVALAAGAVALVQRHHARNEATAALAGQLGFEAVSEPRLDLAMLLAAEAVRLHDSPQTEGTLLATLLRSPTALATFTSPLSSRPQRLAIAPDGATLAVSDNLGDVRFYDVRSRRSTGVVSHFGVEQPATFLPGGRVAGFGFDSAGHGEIQVRSAHTLRIVQRLAPDARFRHLDRSGGPIDLGAPVAATAAGSTLYLAWSVERSDQTDGATFVDRWDLRTGRLTATGATGTVGASAVASTPRGLVVVGAHGAVLLDPRTLRVVRRMPLSATAAVAAVAPDGGTIAIGTSGGAVVFVSTAGLPATTITGANAAAVSAAAFSPDGRTFVSAAEDGSLLVWNAATERVEQRLTGHASRILGVAFSPDGRTLFACSLDGVIFEWDLGGKRRLGVPFSFHAVPYGQPDVDPEPPLAVSGDSTRFAIRDGRRTIRILDSNGRRVASFSARGADATALAWSPTAPLLAVAGHAGALQLWNVAAAPHVQRTLRGLRSTDGLGESVETAAFSPDGRLLAAGDVNHTGPTLSYRYGTVGVWDVRTGRLRWRVRNRGGWVHQVAFSRDGRLLAAAQEDGGIRIYRAADGRLERTIRPEGAGPWTYGTLAFGPGDQLASGMWAGTAQLWNAATGASLTRPTGAAAAPVSTLAFDPRGTLLVSTGGSDGSAKLWNAPELTRFGSDLPGDPGTWGDAAFTPDGTHLIVAYSDGHGVVWPVSEGALLQHACTVAGRNFTREEWSRFVGDRPFVQTCG